MSSYKFTKMTGAGNDFVLFDKNDIAELDLSPDIIRKVCDRRFGVGADGILVVGDNKDYSFEMLYFNADGSTGSLCGNGARCAIKYAGLSNRIPKGEKRTFVCGNEVYSGVIFDEDVEFSLNEPFDYRPEIVLHLETGEIISSFLDTGSPHAVVNLAENVDKTGMYDLSTVPVFAIGRKIRYNEAFAPDGTNVNFIKIESGKIYIRTYERGVEDETLACGTGSTAAAVIECLKGHLQPPVTVVTKGGNLVVNFIYQDGKIENLTLTGPAGKVFSGEIEI